MKQLQVVLVLLLVGRGLQEEDKKSSSSNTDHPKSAQLLWYDDVTHRVLLNTALLDELAALPGPLHVVTAIGDARIGKSTALNVMTALLTTRDKKGRVNSVPPVFSVCQSLETCTKGVWVHMVPLPEGGHMVMLDVEGTDLGGDLVTTQFSLLTSYLSSDILIFLRESVPKRAAIFLHELARLKERLKSHTSKADVSQMLYVTIRDPLKPPEDMSLKSYVSKTLTNPTYCLDSPNECKLLEKYFPLIKVNVYSLPYISRRHQKSLEWTLKDKNYFKTVSSLTFDLRAAIEASTEMLTHGQVLSGIIRTFMRTLQPSMAPGRPAGFSSSNVCMVGDEACDAGLQDAQDEPSPTGAETISVTLSARTPPPSTDSVSDTAVAPDGSDQPAVTAGGPEKVGTLDIEKIIKSPFETMGPGVYSFVMDNINRLRPSPEPTVSVSEQQRDDSDDDEDDDDNECKDLDGLGCSEKKAKPTSKWVKAVRDFIDDIADALDDFFGSVMYE